MGFPRTIVSESSATITDRPNSLAEPSTFTKQFFEMRQSPKVPLLTAGESGGVDAILASAPQLALTQRRQRQPHAALSLQSRSSGSVGGSGRRSQVGPAPLHHESRTVGTSRRVQMNATWLSRLIQ
jgi:hypothetical protein